MLGVWPWARALAALVLGASVVACGSPPTPSPRLGGSDPVGLPGGATEAIHDSLDPVTPGTPFGWSVLIRNVADERAVVDGYELVDASPGLEVLGAASVPTAPYSAMYGHLVFVTDAVRSAVAARPLVGSWIGTTKTGGWVDGGYLVFILRVPTADPYSVSAVRLRYHVGSQAFETTLKASFDVGGGPSGPPGSVAPDASPSAGG